MRTTKRPVRSVAAVAVAASLMLGTAACGSDSDGAASADKVETTTMMTAEALAGGISQQMPDKFGN